MLDLIIFYVISVFKPHQLNFLKWGLTMDWSQSHKTFSEQNGFSNLKFDLSNSQGCGFESLKVLSFSNLIKLSVGRL